MHPILGPNQKGSRSESSPLGPYLVSKRQFERPAAPVHPPLHHPHRPQKEPTVLVAGLELELRRGVVVAVEAEGEGAAADAGSPHCFHDGVNIGVWEPALGKFKTLTPQSI